MYLPFRLPVCRLSIVCPVRFATAEKTTQEIDYYVEDRSKIEAFLKAKGIEISNESLTQLKATDFKTTKIRSLYKRYNNSHLEMLMKLFPECNLLPWQFHSVPNYYWHTYENQRKFFDWYKQTYNINTPSDWKNICRKHFFDKGGRFIKDLYSSNLVTALTSVYPEIPWYNVFPHTNNWDDESTFKLHLDRLEELLHIKDKNDWLNITKRQISELGYGVLVVNGLRAFLQRVIKIKNIDAELPEWDNIEYVRKYLEKLQKHYNFSDSEWHLVTRKQVIEFNGALLLRKYHSLAHAVNAAFPNLNIIPPTNHFQQRDGYWQSRENVVNLLEDVKMSCGVDDLISTSTTILKEHGAGPALNYFKTKKALFEFAYPHRDFENFRTKKPVGYWDDPVNIINFVRELEQKLPFSFDSPYDWYNVTNEQLKQHTQNSSLFQKKKRIEVLQICYPDCVWDKSKLSRRVSRKQTSEEVNKQ